MAEKGDYYLLEPKNPRADILCNVSGMGMVAERKPREDFWYDQDAIVDLPEFPNGFTREYCEKLVEDGFKCWDVQIPFGCTIIHKDEVKRMLIEKALAV